MASTPVHFFRVTMTVNLDVGVKEAIENEAKVAVMEFENGETILDLKPFYEPPREDIEEAVMAYNTHIVSGGTGGGVGFLLLLVVTVFCCYHWRRCVQQQVAARRAADMLEMATKLEHLKAPLTITQGRLYPALVRQKEQPSFQAPVEQLAPPEEKIYIQFGINRI
jgi:hypothetical protein